MKLKDVIKLSAVYLGREKVFNYLEKNENSSDKSVMAQVDVLTRCANVVISELASTFFPLVKKEKLKAENGKINYSFFSEIPLEILKVTDNDNEVFCKVEAEYVVVDRDVVTIEYKYLPSNYGLTDEIGYTEKDISLRILSYGVSAEFCLAERSFDESVMWRKRFSDSLSLALRPKNGKIKQRSFV